MCGAFGWQTTAVGRQATGGAGWVRVAVEGCGHPCFLTAVGVGPVLPGKARSTTKAVHWGVEVI